MLSNSMEALRTTPLRSIGPTAHQAGALAAQRTFDSLYSESCKSLNSLTVSTIRLIGSSRFAQAIAQSLPGLHDPA